MLRWDSYQALRTIPLAWSHSWSEDQDAQPGASMKLWACQTERRALALSLNTPCKPNSALSTYCASDSLSAVAKHESCGSIVAQSHERRHDESAFKTFHS